MSKRKPKVEAPAWWCSKCHSTDVCGGGLGGCVGPHCENCGGVDCLVRLADPRRDAVMKAAVRYERETTKARAKGYASWNWGPAISALKALVAAVKKMQRGGK